MKIIRDFFDKREYLTAGLILMIVLSISFYDIVFLDHTLLTSPFSVGTTPSGPYGCAQCTHYLPVIDPGASAWQYEPSLVLASELYKSYSMPIWNPYMALGTPFAADIISSVYYPLNFVVYFAPKYFFWDIVDLVLIFRLFIAGFFTYLFMREINISKYGSLVASIAFMLNGYFVLYINMCHLNVEVLIPVLLYAFEKIIKTPNIKYCIIAAVIIAISILGGMPESNLFAFSLVGLYYVYRVLSIVKTKRHLTERYIFSFLISFLLGLLCSTILILPFIEYLNLSWNKHPDSTGLHYLRFSFDTISTLCPYFFGQVHNTWNNLSQHQILPYIGVLTFFFVLCSITSIRHKNNINLFFICISLICLLKIYGSPLINWIGYLPLFNISIFPKYCYPEFAFSIAVLAGIGFDNLTKLNIRKLYFRIILIFIIIGSFFVFNLKDMIKSDWATWLFGIKFNAISWTILHLGFSISILIILAVILYMQYKFNVNEQRTMYLLILLLILELFVYIPHVHPYDCDPFNPAPYIQFLKNDTEMYRVVGLDYILYPNTASAYSIFDARGFSPMHIDSYMKFVRENVDPSLKDPYTRFDGSKLDIDTNNIGFLSLINVKYILTTEYIFPYDFGTFEDGVLIDYILNNAGKNSKNKGSVTITQFDNKTVLFQHPPSEIICPILIPNSTAFLDFSIGVNSAVWSPDKGDGVLFEVFIEPQNRDKIFSKYIDPKNDAEDRKWHDMSINLSSYKDKKVNLIFITSSGPNNSNAYDWAGWGDLSFSISNDNIDVLIDHVLNNSKINSMNENFVKKVQFDNKTVLFEHPPSEIIYPISVPNSTKFLNFSIGVSSAVWSPDKGDGVLFEVFIEPQNRDKIFSKYIDPKNDAEDRKWHDESINLSSYKDKKMNLIFITSSGPNNSSAYDWAGWGELYLRRSNDSEELAKKFEQSLELVYDNDIKIYENKKVLPRTFICPKTIDSPKEMGINTNDTIFIEISSPITNNSNKYSSVPEYPNNSSSKVKEYGPSNVAIQTESSDPGFLILTDAYYPGWKVYVDGEEKDILIANCLFRAIYLEKGTHYVEFIYEPLSFKIGFWISCLTLFGMLSIYLIIRRRRRRA